MSGVPPALAALDKLAEDYDRLGVDYEAFREYLVAKHVGR